MTVITISRQYSSGGDEIASRVCEILGYKIFDKRLIAQAAQEAGLSDQEVIDFSEENRQIHSFFERLFTWPVLAAGTFVWTENPAGMALEGLGISERSMVELVERAIRSAHQMGDMVIVGRGGQLVLRDQPDVLHVRVEAPMEERIQRVKEQLKQTRGEFYADIDIRRDAQDEIEDKDGSSKEYIQHYYHENWSDPLLYHLVLNAGKLSVEQAAEIIAGLARGMPREVSPRREPLPNA